ncbi:MAG: hypothetical protein QN229_02755 [Desulfurococcaceae archaeon TW002]
MLGAVALASMLYLVIIYPTVVQYSYIEATLPNVLIPLIAIALLLEASRRLLGMALPAIAKLVAHMFVFYFGILADLTSPVALASYAGTLLAKSEFWKTALNVTKYTLAGYLVPYIFALDPALLILPAGSANPHTIYRITYGITNTLLSMLMLSAGIVGWHGTHIGKLQRALLIVLGIANLAPYEYITPVLVATYVGLYIHNIRKVKTKTH